MAAPALEDGGDGGGLVEEERGAGDVDDQEQGHDGHHQAGEVPLQAL